MARVCIAIALLAASAAADNVTSALDTCGFGPWSQALEDWATSPQSDRHGRIMALPATKGYYVTERIDTPYLSPPPPQYSPYPQASQHNGPAPSPQGPYYSNEVYVPPHPSQMSPSQGHIPLNQGYGPPSKGPKSPGKAPGASSAAGHREWDGAPPGLSKIVNKPPRPAHRPQDVDRVDEPPRKHVSETDLFLLSAIEKLVYRADLMEKRLRSLEDDLHQLLAKPTRPDPCPSPFVRVGEACYSWGLDAQDWKRAAQDCRARGAALVELLQRPQRRALLASLHSHDKLKGHDYWTGGLNPGLLWIWSHSARPLQPDAPGANATVAVPGAGRCLALAWDAARRTHAYRGRDCSHALRYVCERAEAPPARASPPPSARASSPPPVPATSAPQHTDPEQPPQTDLDIQGP